MDSKSRGTSLHQTLKRRVMTSWSAENFSDSYVNENNLSLGKRPSLTVFYLVTLQSRPLLSIVAETSFQCFFFDF